MEWFKASNVEKKLHWMVKCSTHLQFFSPNFYYECC